MSTNRSQRPRAPINIHHNTNRNHQQLPRTKTTQVKKLQPTHPPPSNTPSAQARPNIITTRSPRTRSKMVNFTVPDDDTDSFVSEQDMAMEIDGDSFEEQIDGFTRVQSDPNWQAQEAANHQHPQQQYFQVQQQEEQTQPSYTPTHQGHHNFRPAQPARSRTPYISRTHDQHMINAEVPSSTGKRKRSESQPPARDAYHCEPDTIYHPAARCVGGMVVTMYMTLYTWTTTVLSYGWAYLSGQKATATAQNAREQKILAVETDNSGRKRRALTGSNYKAPHVSSPTSSEASNSPTSQVFKPQSKKAPKFTSSRTLNSPTPPPSNSPTPSAEESTAKEVSTPGAFPTASLPSPEQSQSPTGERPEEEKGTLFGRPTRKQRIDTPKPKSKPQEDEDKNPNLKEYSPTPVNSIEPTRAEMDARFPGQRCHTHEDWQTLRDEKIKQRDYTHDQAYNAWAWRQDNKMAAEEKEFEEQEEEFEKTRGQAAKVAAQEVKFPEGLSDEEAYIYSLDHAINHGKGECGQNDIHQRVHEFNGLQAHNRGKVIEAEVVQDHEEISKKKSKAEEDRAFRKTSARNKFSTKGKGRAVENAKQARSGKDRNGRQAGATEEDESRPTTASSHRPANYKGGLEPTPKKLGQPGANIQQPWSWDQTMAPGKSLLKKKKGNEELKNRQVDDLIDRSRRAIIQSPPKEYRIENYLKERRERRRDHWLDYKDNEQQVKTESRTNRVQAHAEAKEKLETVQAQWAQMRIDDANQKQAEEEEAARRVAEDLAKQKAIENELARKAAEEAEKLKAEEEKAAADAAEAQATYNRKQILIRTLDSEWAERVKKTTAIENKDAVVAKSLDGTELLRHDFKSLLDSSAWLNDNIVNAFISAIVARKQEQAGHKRGANNVPPYEAYNSAWYTTYKKVGIEGIQRWSKRKGIQGEKLLRAEKIFFPINTGAHWQLLIISPQERKIEFLCSLSRASKLHFKAARDWLEMELGPKNYVAEEWTESSQRSSSQTNTDDCGAFVAMNALAAGKGYPFSDVTAAKMREARKMVAAVLLNGGLVGDWEL